MLDYRSSAPSHQIYRYCPLCTGELIDEHDTVNGRIRPTCAGCGWEYYPTNHLGALAVVEVDAGIVLVQPPGGPSEAPASLPGGRVEYGEAPEAAVIRIVREQTGLDVEVVSEIAQFLQPGTPFGPSLMFGYLTRATAGNLISDGPEGPATVYTVDSMPAIIPVRVANQRVINTYVAGLVVERRDGIVQTPG